MLSYRCDHCQIACIDGVLCHELRCPDAWRDELRECKWCGTEFEPEEKHQRFCGEDCAEYYA